VRAGGQCTETDMTKLIVALCNFVNAHNNEILSVMEVIVAKQHKYIDEEMMDYTSELVYHPVIIFCHPIFYLKTQRYQCIQS